MPLPLRPIPAALAFSLSSVDQGRPIWALRALGVCSAPQTAGKAQRALAGFPVALAQPRGRCSVATLGLGA
jgi:hypothetical protein